MRIHFLGICGYAVSGLALIAKQLGNDVTGSDEDAYPPTTEILTRAGIPWVDGHDAGNVTRWGKPDLVVQGNQVREGNPETDAARRLHLRLISEAEYWGGRTADRFRIVVAGSGGKTTTASLVAWILRAAGRNAGFRLGMAVKDLGSAAAWGSGRDFVFEGDEYTSAVFDPRPKFLHFAPQLAVLTNIDWDHPDVFPDPAAYEAVFRELLEYLGPEDRLIAGSDDPTVRRLLSRTRAGVETYGLRGGADWHGRDVQIEGEGMRFTAWHAGKVLAVVTSRLPGEHNAANALAALATAVRIGVPVPTAVDAIGRFHGVSRRFEIRGQVRGVTLVDDYAHHPAKVRATLEAARDRFHPGRLLPCFVPHSWYRIGGRARYFLELADDAALPRLLARLDHDQQPYLVIGAGTNTLFAATELPGLTIKLVTRRLSMAGDVVSVSAGYPMPKLAAETAKAGRAGLEFAAGVPGTVGGSVFGNAGAFGGEVKSGLLSAEVIDRQGRRQTMAAADCAFGYRDSVFKTVRDGWAIVSARFRTTSESPKVVLARLLVVQTHR